MANDRDPRSDLGAWLGEELRRARLDAGFTSQDQVARELGFDRTVIVKAETGARPPSEDVAPKIAEMFPGLCNGLYVRLAAIARKSNGPIPGWFADWLSREREATSVRIWQPIIVPGLLQTADYAQALFVGERKGIDADALADLVAARIGRQAIFDKPASGGYSPRRRKRPQLRLATGAASRDRTGTDRPGPWSDRLSGELLDYLQAWNDACAADGADAQALQERGRELAIQVQDELGTDGWEVLYQMDGRMLRVHPPGSWPVESWKKELLGYHSRSPAERATE